MPGKILVAYASKTNATAQHASAIAGALKAAGRDVDIVDLREIGKPELAGYEAFVIGSGIRMGRWYGPARRLLKNKELAGKRIALFAACCMVMDASKKDVARRDYVEKIANKFKLKMVSGRAFVGMLPRAKGDKFIDTTASQRWGRELAERL